ncbi:MAG: hypothetical protein HYZ28_21965 [Myxococcales bacterium]|nr:hypothetical protein [Myxococcales bacterium]
MPLPDLASVCVEIKVGKQDLCVTFPGGAEMCVQLPTTSVPDPMELSKQLMAQANAALAPLVPMFNILDVVLALFACVKAIPDSLGPPPDPSKLAKCIPDLAEKAGKLLKLIPQLSVPLMIVGLIDVLLSFLEGLRGQLKAIIDAQVKIAQAATRAAELGNVQLQTVVDCANANIEAQMKNLGEGAAPVNRLIGVINLFMEIVGLPKLPDLSNLGTDAQAALAPLDAIVEQLKTARAAIPV